jgi:hypothetical protein
MAQHDKAKTLLILSFTIMGVVRTNQPLTYHPEARGIFALWFEK